MSVNLAPFPNGWVTDNPWGNIINQLNVFQDTYITHNGAYTIRIDPLSTTPNSAFDFWKVDVAPYDIISMAVWAKANGINPQLYCGARIGLDLYGPKGAITGYSRDSTLNAVINPVWTGVGEDGYVHWGQDWTRIGVTFQIPPISIAEGVSAGYPTQGEQVVPTGIVPWCQNWCSPPFAYPADAYPVYFSEFELYRTSLPTPNWLPTIALVSVIGTVVYLGVLR